MRTSRGPRGRVRLRLPTLLLAGVALASLGAGTPDMALAWLLGDYRSPLYCDVEGEPFRVLRRIRATPKKRSPHRPTVRLQFYDLDAPTETRCYMEDGTDQHNWIGVLELVHDGRRDRPDLAGHEFSETLRREGGFDFRIAQGRLRHGTPGRDASALEVKDFAGGVARMREARPGQDAHRRLADFGERRKLTLQIEAPDGTTFDFDLAQTGS